MLNYVVLTGVLIAYACVLLDYNMLVEISLLLRGVAPEQPTIEDKASPISFVLHSTCGLARDDADILASGLTRFGVTTVDSLKGVDNVLIEAAAYDGHKSLSPKKLEQVFSCFDKHYGSSTERQDSELHDECALAEALIRLGEAEAEAGNCNEAQLFLKDAVKRAKKCPEMAADAEWELHQAVTSCGKEGKEKVLRPPPTAECSKLFPKIHGDERILNDFEVLENSGGSLRTDSIHWLAWYALFEVDATNACNSAMVGKAWRTLSLTYAPEKQVGSDVKGVTKCATDAMLIISAGKEALIERSPCAKNRSGLHSKDKHGNTPLHIAAQQGNLKVMQLLLDNNAVINKADKQGRTPLYVAAQNGQLSAIKMLLDSNADVNEASNEGVTPLLLAVQTGDASSVEMLLEGYKEGFGDIDKANNNGETPLYAAAQNGHVSIALQLIDKKALVSKADKNGETPLSVAAYDGHLQMVSLLLENGAAVNRADKDGVRPLFIAAQNGHYEVVKVLLEKNAVVNEPTKDGMVPLLIAAGNGYTEVVKLLLEEGKADVNLELEVNGWTPMQVAANEEIKALLREHGAIQKERGQKGE
jgi:ankyrin repeat protein